MPGPIGPISIATNAARGTTLPLPDLGIVLPASGATPYDISTLEELRRFALQCPDCRDFATDDAHTGSSSLVVYPQAAGGGTAIDDADVINYIANLLLGIADGGSGGEPYTVLRADSTGDFDAGGGKVENLAAGTVSGDAVEFDQFVAAVAGLDAKGSVIVLNAYPQDTLSGLPTIDGVGPLTDSQRVLLVAEGTEEETEITAVADSSGSLSGTYFLYYTPDNTYYVWIDVDDGSTDPNVGGAIGIECDISENDTAATVANAVRDAMHAIGDITCSAVSTATWDATPTKAGNTTDATDTGSTGFTLTPTDGTGGLLAGHVNNGIWEVHSGAWTRPSYFDTGQGAASAFTHVESGTVYADQKWLCTNNSGSDVIDTDALIFTEFPMGGSGAQTWRKEWHWGRRDTQMPKGTAPFYLIHSDGLTGLELEQLRLRDGEVSAIGLEIDAADAEDIDVEIYVEGNTASPIATLTLTAGNTEAYDNAISGGNYNAGDSIAVALTRPTGTNKSTPVHFSVTVELKESA